MVNSLNPGKQTPEVMPPRTVQHTALATKRKNLTHCCSLREGNLAADEVLIEFQKAPLDSINTVYKVTWGSHLPICFGPLRKTFAKSLSVGPATYVPAVSGFFSPYTKLKRKTLAVDHKCKPTPR